MGGMSSQVFWRQRYDDSADSVLKRVLDTLQCEVRELPSQQWDPRTSSISGIRDVDCSYVSPGAPEWSAVLLHLSANNGERLAAEISKAISRESILILEYDQAAWGYVLFLDGAESDRFWNAPEIVEEDATTIRGTPSLLNSVFGVPESIIAPYLQHRSSQSPETSKAFPDDEFALNDHWVRVDFMRRLGLQYPTPGKTAGGRYIQIVEPNRTIARQPEQAISSVAKKSRWKFWQ
jgi:hypothetical protein